MRKNVLVINGKSIALPAPIKTSVCIGDVIVVLMESTPSSTSIQNILGFNKEGDNIWTIDGLEEIEYNGKKYKGIDGPYTDIVEVSKHVLNITNWDGTTFYLDARNGSLLSNPIESRVQKRPW